MATIVLGLMKEPHQAGGAVRALDAEGFDRRDIDAIGGLVGALRALGVPADHAHTYAEGVRRGGRVVCVRAEDDLEAEHAADIMLEHGAVDIEACAAGWKAAGWSGRTAQPDTAAAVEHYALAFGEYPGAPGRMYHEPHGQRRSPSVYFVGSVTDGPYSGPERRDGHQPFVGGNRRGD